MRSVTRECRSKYTCYCPRTHEPEEDIGCDLVQFGRLQFAHEQDKRNLRQSKRQEVENVAGVI